jgi:hypothetical protein
MKKESRQLRGAELFAAGFPELAARNEEGRQRAATPVDGQMNPKASVDQRTTAPNVRHFHANNQQNKWNNTREMDRFIAALCAEPRVGRKWMENVARTAAAIERTPDFTRELITKMLSQPPAYPSEVAEVVAAAYAQHGGVE